MIHKLTPQYLDRLNSQKNWKLFFSYLIAAASGVILLQQFGVQAAPICAAALILAALFHWKLNQLYQISRKEADHVQIEINDEHLIYRNSLGEQLLLLNQLRSVSQGAHFDPIKLVFTHDRTIMLDGFNNAEQLVAELKKHVEN